MRRKQRESRKGVWFSAFLVAILVFSVGGYIFGSAPSKIQYNEHTFTAVQGGYILEVNNHPLAFTYFPEQLETLPFPGEAGGMLSGRPMFYVTYSPNSSLAQDIALAQFRMQNSLISAVNVYVQPAITADANFSIPVISCSNSTKFVPVVLFEESNITDAAVEDSCIVIQAKESRDVSAYSERMIYSILGVME